MNRNYVLICLFGFLTYFALGSVGREAIIGGKETSFKPFRYIVSLTEVNQGHICGGAIVGEQHILTAAHCFVQKDNTFKRMRVIALMGTENLNGFSESTRRIEVETVYVPKDYNAADINTTGDIAVLKLKEPIHVAYDKNLKQIKLEPNQKEDHSAHKATIAGWGWNKVQIAHNELTGRRTDPMLRMSTADVFNNYQCQLEHPRLVIYQEHLCARLEQEDNSHENRGVCHGDDGSPLVRDGFVIGVLSKYPYNCTERGISAIYTRVSYYLTFIFNAKTNVVTRNMLAHNLLHP